MGYPKEETLNYRYSDDRRLAKTPCQHCKKEYWVFVYDTFEPTIKACCACRKGKEFRDAYVTAKWLSRM